MSIRTRVLLLAAIGCALSAPASAAAYLKFDGVKGEVTAANQTETVRGKADILVEGLSPLQGLPASRKAARNAQAQAASAQAGSEPFTTGEPEASHLLAPAVQKLRSPGHNREQ